MVASSVDLQSTETGRASYTYFKIERRRWFLWEELNGGWLSRRDGLQECRSEMLPGTARYRAVVDAYTVAEVANSEDASPSLGRPVWRSPNSVTHHYRYVSPSVRLTRSADNRPTAAP